MCVKTDEKNDWVLIEILNLLNPDNLKEKEIIFKAKDLLDWFTEFEGWWLQIKDDDVCVSYEGESSKPHFYGKIKTIKEVLY